MKKYHQISWAYTTSLVSRKAKIQKSQETDPKEEVWLELERLQKIMVGFRGRISSMKRGKEF